MQLQIMPMLGLLILILIQHQTCPCNSVLIQLYFKEAKVVLIPEWDVTVFADKIKAAKMID